MREQIRKFDSSKMFALIKDFSAQCRRAVETAAREEFNGAAGGFESAVVAGMGGSAIGGDMLSCIAAREIECPFAVIRDYYIPAFVGKKTLFLAASYSGNTEETLSACSLALKRGAVVVGITSGGALAKLCAENGAHTVLIPPGQPPRTALGYMFFPMLLKLVQSGLLAEKDRDILNTFKLISDMSGRLGDPDGPAGETARRLHGAVPVIYGSSAISSCAAFRWRTQINENSKALACTASFPEMNHNEIVGWKNPADMLGRMPVVLLRDRQDHERVRTRMDITKLLIGGSPPAVIEVWSEGESLLERIFSLIYYGDFVSFYLAILNGEDPTPVERIETLKERLKEK